MLVFADGRTVGTIGGGCYENDAFWKAREAITSAAAPLVHYDLNDDFAQENGLICGGQMDVYIEPIAPSPRALHHRRRPRRLAPRASSPQSVGFRIHVVDDREKFANASASPRADDRRRRHPGVAAQRRRCRRTPTS